MEFAYSTRDQAAEPANDSHRIQEPQKGYSHAWCRAGLNTSSRNWTRYLPRNPGFM